MPDTAAYYRIRAATLLERAAEPATESYRREELAQQAAVWAQIATSAAISEQSRSD